jgi:hypothetical protein
MAPKGAEDNHATTQVRSDIGYQPNRGQLAGMNNWRSHFAKYAVSNLVVVSI